MCFASLLSLFHLVRPFNGAKRNVATSTVITEQHILRLLAMQNILLSKQYGVVISKLVLYLCFNKHYNVLSNIGSLLLPGVFFLPFLFYEISFKSGQHIKQKIFSFSVMQVNILALHYHLNEKNYIVLYCLLFCFSALGGLNLKIHG